MLIEFAKLLNLERKKADAPVTELESTTKVGDLNDARQEAAGVRSQELLGKMLVKLAQRQEIAPGAT